MRNLKRALSLALASVMLLGMMVVGTSAASYPDVDDNDNVEAIEVLNAVNVMIGRQGNFEPDEAVNRHEMAVIMAKLVLGVETADSYVGTHPFTDVVPWADKYVAACYENGLVAGTSATTYGGGSPLTAVQAAAMMLRALGYKDLNKGYQGDWRAPITAMANQIRLFAGVASNPNEKLNRNQVAQLALNTLKSPMVNLKDNTISWTDGEGQVIITGGSREYLVLSSREAYAYAINEVESSGNSASGINGATVELGEHLYNGKLRLNNNDIDAFGRPSRTWEYDGKAIGTYVKEELIRADYTTKVTGRELYEKLGASTLKDYTLDIYIDGVSTKAKNASLILGNESYGPWFDENDLNRNNNQGVGATGNGVLTQVFVDTSAKVVTISIINTYLAKADEDYDDRTEVVDIDVYGIEKVSGTDEYAKITSSSPDRDHVSDFEVASEDFALAKDVKDGDPLLVTVAKGEVQSVAIPEVLSAVTISSFSRGSSVTTGGTKYDYSSAAEYDWEVLDWYTQNNTVNLKDIQYNVYLDGYGYAIGVDIVEAANNYAFVTAIQRTGSHLANMYADANVIFLDGTMETVRVDLSKSTLPAYVDGLDSILNTWVTFSKNNNGNYTLKQVADVTNTRGVSRLGANTDYVPGGDRNSTKIAQAWTDPVTVSKVNRTHLSLNGGGNSTVGFNRVYGNDNTVYLTAKLDELDHDSDAGNENYGVIKGVADVVTGVNNVDLEVYTLDDARKEAETNKVGGTIPTTDDGDQDMTEHDTYSHTSHGTYALYNKDGYVIAAMVVGNNGVNNRSLAYVHSASGIAGVKDETDNGSSTTRAAGDGMYTWTREVTISGEKALLTEVGDQLTYLDEMERGTWYQVSYNSNGEVIAIANATGTGYYNDTNVDVWRLKAHSVKDGKDIAEYVTDINWLEDSLDEYSTVLYHETFNTGHPYMIGNTLYATTKNRQGFYVTNDVKVALFQWERNEDWKGEWTSGASRLKSIIDNLNTQNGENYSYTISAVVDGTGATTVIIRDWTNTYERPESGKAQELRLYGNLFNAKNYETDRYDAVVTAGDVELEPIRTGTNAYGAYTVYSVKAGERVGINDKDIAGNFKLLTNLKDIDPDNDEVDLQVRRYRNSISFVMPNESVFLVGSDEEIVEAIVGEKSEDESLSNITATFDGGEGAQGEGRKIADMSAGDPVTITLKKGLVRAITLVADAKYTVTLGDPTVTREVKSDTNGEITINYTLTNTDILNGYVRIEKIVEGWKDEDDKVIADDELTFNVPTVTLGGDLDDVTVPDGSHYMVTKTVWTNEDGETVTKAETAGTYTWTATVVTEKGYTFEDGETTTTKSGTVVVADTSKQATVTVTTVEGATVKVNNVSPDDNGKVIVEAGEVTVTVEVADETKVAVIKVDTVENKTGKFTAEAGETYAVDVTLKEKTNEPGSDLPNAPGATANEGKTVVTLKYVSGTTLDKDFIMDEVNKVEGISVKSVLGTVTDETTTVQALLSDDSDTITVNLVEVFEVKLDNDLIGYVPETGDNTNFTVEDGAHVIDKTDRTTDLVSGGKIVIAAGVDSNLDLATAYAVQFTTSGGIASAKTDAGATVQGGWPSLTVDTNMFLCEGEKVSAVGKATGGEEYIHLKAGETDYTDGRVLSGQTAKTWEYTVAAADANSGAIVIDEIASYKVSVDGSDKGYIVPGATVAVPTDAAANSKYIGVQLVTGDTPESKVPQYWDATAGTHTLTTTANAPADGKSFILLDTTNAAKVVKGNGEIELRRAVVVDATASTTVEVSLNGTAGKERTTVATDLYVVGAKLDLSADGDGKVFTVGGKKVANTVAGTDSAPATGSYTIPTNATASITIKLAESVTTLTLTNVKAVINGTGTTEVEAIAVDGSKAAVDGTPSATRQGESDSAASNVTEDSIVTGDTIVVTVKVKGAGTTGNTVEELTKENVTLEDFHASRYTVNSVTITDDGATIVFTFTAQAAADTYNTEAS